MTIYTPSVTIDSAFMFGHWELLIVFLLILIVFGAGKLPSVFSSLGEGVKNFKKSMKEEEDDKSAAPKPAEKTASQQVIDDSKTVEALKVDKKEKAPAEPRDPQNGAS
jgi:sec-independent protein translocase protein TatA